MGFAMLFFKDAKVREKFEKKTCDPSSKITSPGKGFCIMESEQFIDLAALTFHVHHLQGNSYIPTFGGLYNIL